MPYQQIFSYFPVFCNLKWYEWIVQLCLFLNFARWDFISQFVSFFLFIWLLDQVNYYFVFFPHTFARSQWTLWYPQHALMENKKHYKKKTNQISISRKLKSNKKSQRWALVLSGCHELNLCLANNMQVLLVLSTTLKVLLLLTLISSWKTLLNFQEMSETFIFFYFLFFIYYWLVY